VEQLERRVGAIRQRSEPVDEEGAGDKEEVEENEVEEEEETAGEEAGDEDEERGDGSYGTSGTIATTCALGS
jgi:hypothetical protein